MERYLRVDKINSVTATHPRLHKCEWWTPHNHSSALMWSQENSASWMPCPIWHSRGQRFDPAYLHQKDLKLKDFRSFSLYFLHFLGAFRTSPESDIFEEISNTYNTTYNNFTLKRYGRSVKPCSSGSINAEPMTQEEFVEQIYIHYLRNIWNSD